MVSREDGEDVVVRFVGVCVTKPVRAARECEIGNGEVEPLEGGCVGLGTVVDRREKGLGEVGEGAGGDLGEVEFHVGGEVVGCAGCRGRVAAAFVGVVGCKDGEGFVVFTFEEELAGEVLHKVSIWCWAFGFVSLGCKKCTVDVPKVKVP